VWKVQSFIYLSTVLATRNYIGLYCLVAMHFVVSLVNGNWICGHTGFFYLKSYSIATMCEYTL